MDNRIWADVNAAFEQRRQENAWEEDRRQREIENKHPELFSLMQKRHEMVLGAVRRGLSGGEMEDPEALMRSYNEKIAAQLAACGYPKDYLAPVCQCKICQDAGYIYDNSLQKPCQCLLSAYRQALSSQEEGMAGQTFSTFDETRFPEEPLPGTDVTQREYMRIVRDRCLQYAMGVFQGPVKTLLLHGGSGLGKTFLLHCVEAKARERGVDTLYVTAYDLLMQLKNAYFSRNGETAQEYFDASLLLIDDLGMEPLMENITVEQFYNLLNSRLTRGLYTAVSTNLSREELRARYTERLSSRLLDTRGGMAIPFLGKDIRLMKG